MLLCVNRNISYFYFFILFTGSFKVLSEGSLQLTLNFSSAFTVAWTKWPSAYWEQISSGRFTSLDMCVV